MQEALRAVYSRSNLLIENQLDEQGHHLVIGNVDLLCQELQADATVGLDDVLQHLEADVPQEVLQVGPDERIREDPVGRIGQQLVDGLDVILLVRRAQISHGADLRVVLVHLRLPRVERVDGRQGKHVCEHDVLEHGLRACGVPGLLVVLERLEELVVGGLPLLLAHVHLPPTLADDGNVPGVRDGRSEVDGLRVDLLHPQGVLGERARLDLQRIDLQQVRALAHVVGAVGLLARLVQGPHEALELLHVAHFKVELGELGARAEPESLVGGCLQRIQGELVDGLQLREVAGRRHGVKHCVDGLARIVPRDLVHVTQQLAIARGHLIEAANPGADHDDVLEGLESPDDRGAVRGLQGDNLLELLQSLLRKVLLVVVRLVEGVLYPNRLLIAILAFLAAIRVVVRLILELVRVRHAPNAPNKDAAAAQLQVGMPRSPMPCFIQRQPVGGGLPSQAEPPPQT
mmetsp:Transcript_95788/g.254358  ORF Transcript_95788/g.254358 Transcript_95788/m.254358 type:complete len:459 (+) Transcript_95788:183-1559(+)